MEPLYISHGYDPSGRRDHYDSVGSNHNESPVTIGDIPEVVTTITILTSPSGSIRRVDSVTIKTHRNESTVTKSNSLKVCIYRRSP